MMMMMMDNELKAAPGTTATVTTAATSASAAAALQDAFSLYSAIPPSFSMPPTSTSSIPTVEECCVPNSPSSPCLKDKKGTTLSVYDKVVLYIGQ